MGDGAMVRNSRALGVFAEILHGPQGNLRAVEIAGRGISAAVRCTLSVIDDKLAPSATSDTELQLQNAISFADRLMELGVVEDDLAEVWRCRCMGEIDDASFEGMLREIVVRLESWPHKDG